MKPKNLLFLLGMLIFTVLHSLSLNAQTAEEYNYSIKNRWTIKASYSRYKTAFWGDVFANIGNNFILDKMREMSNFKVETNYGINKFIEVGIFTGFQHYEWLEDYSSDMVYERNRSFAPLFGVNANFHILPFLVQSEKCRWDLYLTTKYGGCYLPHTEIDHPNFPSYHKKYRQEYGLGIGAGYYFKNIIGIFAEGSLGQFYYFSKYHRKAYIMPDGHFKWVDYTDNNFRFRIGIAAKINR